MANKTAEQLIAEFDKGIVRKYDLQFETVEIGTPCLICEEHVPVFGIRHTPKICEKCKAAVMKVRAEDDK